MRTVSEYFATFFPGKVQKIAVNAGLGCPNRDGTISRGGCIYCNNASFNPRYIRSTGNGQSADAANAVSITEQLRQGKLFFAKKHKPYGYLAYFQSFSNTYGDTPHLISLYEEALADPEVVGLVIATRPDCLEADLLDYFHDRFTAPGAPFLLVELGIESTLDSTLQRINRGHNYACACRAVHELASRGIQVGAHLILGLPGESREDMLGHARRISELPLFTLKLHQLQVIKGTALEKNYLADPSSLRLFSAREYAQLLCEFIPLLRPDIALDRLVSESPSSLLLAPAWGLKPAEFSSLLAEYLPDQIG